MDQFAVFFRPASLLHTYILYKYDFAASQAKGPCTLAGALRAGHIYGRKTYLPIDNKKQKTRRS